MYQLTIYSITTKNFAKSKVLLRSCLLLFTLLITVYSAVYAQTAGSIKGVVVDETGLPMMGVSVMARAPQKNSAQTSKEGVFELRNIPAGSTLRFTFVGYSPVEIKLAPGQHDVKIRMEPAAASLADVVVNTGLYKRPVGNFTGASNTVTGEQLRNTNPNNVIKALASIDPSLRIVENNVMGSDPNSLPVIQLRGQNNLPSGLTGTESGVPAPVSNGDIMSSYLSNPNEPLIIMDGFQTTLQSLYDMDINRIERITVLKDAAATVAYGSKAANGVIVVETKRPTAGRIQVSYAINFNLQVADLSSYNLLDAQGLLEAQRLAGIFNDNINHANDIGLKQWYDRRLYDIRSGVNTYWLSQPVRNGLGFNNSLSLSGGTKAVRFSMNLGYNNSVGVMKGSGRTAFNLSSNLSYNNKNLRFSNVTSVTRGEANNSPWGSFSQYAKQFPYFKPYDSAGNIIKIFEPSGVDAGIPVNAPGGIFTNAMYNTLLQVKDYSYYLSFSNATNFEYVISNNLRFTAGLNFAGNLPGAEQFLPADHTSFAASSTPIFTELGSYTQTRGRNSVTDGRMSLDFNKRRNGHAIFVSAGVSAQQTTSSSTTINVSGIPNDFLGELGLANGYGTSIKPQTAYNATRSISTYISTSYSYQEKYMAEVTANASGSSQFGSNNRLAPFWAAGAGWNIDREKWFQKNPVVQQLRIRATYGITGNQNFAAFLSSPIYQYNLMNNYRLQLGAYLQGYANPNLKWQQTKKTNLALTTTLFNGLFNIGINGYLENTDNLILPIGVAPSTGFVSYQDNLGSTQNRGYEISIASPVIRNRAKNIFWTLTFNTGHYENVIKSLSPAIDAINKVNNATDGTVNQKSPLPRYEVGQSLTRIWAVRSLGIDPATGNEVFLKRDGSSTFTWDPLDKVPVGDATSKFKGSFGSNLTLKGFTFNILMNYEAGGQMYNQTLLDKIENVDLRTTNADQRVLTDRWKHPGDKVFFKSIASSNLATNATSRFVQNNDYIDASSITVGYTFPSNLAWVKRFRLSTPRLFITQNNVFRIGTIKVERGTGYPFARNFSLGLSTTF